MARLYAAQKDRSNTILCLEKAMDFARQFCTYPADAVQPSLLFRDTIYGGWVKSDCMDSYSLMREWQR